MADFTIEIAGHTAAVHSLFDSTKDYCRAYWSEKMPECSISITPDDLRYEQHLADEEAIEEGFRFRVFTDPFLDRAAIQRKLADFLLPAGCDDYIGLFAVTAGVGLDAMIEGYRAKGDDYSAIMAELIADRLAEAFAEHLHRVVAHELWGYAKDENIGIRPAVGYPCCPNHLLKSGITRCAGAC